MTTIVLDPNKLKRGKEDWKIRFTYNDLNSLPTYPESPLIEILNGELYMVPSPIPNHQRISRNLEFLLVDFFKKNNLAEVFDAPIDVLLSDEDVVIPDLIVVANKNKDIINEKNIQGVPNIIIEILSSNKNHDLINKKAIYEKYKVPEYWIIDPIEESLEVYYFENREDSEYSKESKFLKGDLVTSKVFSNLKVNLEDIFPQK